LLVLFGLPESRYQQIYQHGGRQSARPRNRLRLEIPCLYRLSRPFRDRLRRREKGNWRRERDSNPRRAFDPYTLSRGAPSTTRPSLPRSRVGSAARRPPSYLKGCRGGKTSSVARMGRQPEWTGSASSTASAGSSAPASTSWDDASSWPFSRLMR
jgi:hypothetical protein